MKDMKKLQKQMKKLQKDFQQGQEQLAAQAASFQSICPHVSKKGKTWLIPFMEGEVEKAKCKKCGDVVVVDRDMLSPESTNASVEVVKSMLSELRANVAAGTIQMSDKQLLLMQQFDKDILRSLPGTFEDIQEATNSGGKKKKKDKDKKKGKGKGKKKNKAKRINW
jgi:RecJ-like exonuclease